VCWDVTLPDGTRTQKSQTFDSKPEAEEYKRTVSSAQYRGLIVDPSAGSQLFGPYARHWIDNRVTSAGKRLRPKTIEGYDKLLKLYLNPTFEFVELRHITVPRVRTWYDESCKRSELQTKKAYRLLHAIMTTAHLEFGVALPHLAGYGQETHPERILVDDDIVLEFAERIHPRLRALIFVIGVGGLRPPSEPRGLQRMDVDVAQLSLQVRQGVTNVVGIGRDVEEPKVDAGKRTVAIPRIVMDALVEHMDQFTGPEPDAWVFTNPRGGPLLPAFLYEEFNKVRTELALPESITPYNLRHFSLTTAARTPGMTLKNLMARGGHASSRAALIYQHAAEEVDRSASDFIESRIAAKLAARRGEDAGKVVRLKRSASD
jgi:integrase